MTHMLHEEPLCARYRAISLAVMLRGLLPNTRLSRTENLYFERLSKMNEK